MSEIAKIFIIVGISCLVFGAVLYVFGKIPGAGRLPGDLLIKKENVTVYIPITTCLLISIILTILMYLWNHK